MAWSNPQSHIWATGEIVTAANMNTYITNNLSFLGGTSGAVVATSQTTTSTTYTDLATSGPAVTVTTQTTAVVTLTAQFSNNTINDAAYMSVAVSGSTTLAAADANGVFWQSLAAAGGFNQQGGTVWLSGLTAGSNVFTAKYRANGGTATFSARTITVEPGTA